jgi:hypothetical protein
MGVIHEYLSTQSDLNLETAGEAVHDIVGTRVYVEQLPRSVAERSQAALVIQRFGGAGSPYTTVDNPLIRIKCYGGSGALRASFTLARAVGDRLNGITTVATATGVIMSAIEVQGAQIVIEQETEGMHAFVDYQIEVRAAS